MASETLISSVKQWLEWDPNPESKTKVQDLLNNQDYSMLSSLFEPRVNFGTAGLRSKMDIGYKYMNELVIIQTSQGLAKYLINNVEKAKEQGVMIGFDGRHNSRTFAFLTAAVFKSVGFKVYLYTTYVCTPIIPFGVLHKNTAAGIMITASHNPKHDNGYKVYLSNGAQVCPPIDKDIARAINLNLKPWEQYDISSKLEGIIEDPNDVVEAYFDTITKNMCYHKGQFRDSQLSVTYSAMHGVGARFVKQAFNAFGLPSYIPTVEQLYPDPDFSTLIFPNPEESVDAFRLSVLTAEKEGSNLIFVNDPDADRLGVAVRDHTTRNWVYLSGNEIAALFAEWTWLKWREANPNGDASKCIMITPTNSSKHLKAMADKEGFQFRETLPGFKWTATEALKAVQEGYTCLLAYEVELGYMIGDTSFDKDGVRAAAVLYEAACYWNSKEQNLLDRLNNFYNTYGYFKMNNSYFFCDTTAKLDTIFKQLRNAEGATLVSYDGQAKYPKFCGSYEISSVRDVSLGYDTKQDDGKSLFPIVKNVYMLTFTFANGCSLSLRNSGTEPKLKYYIECTSSESPEKAEELLALMTKEMIDNYIKPSRYGLIHQQK